MRVLIIGSGGRENAIAWKISKSPLLEKLFCAPGNPGTSSLAVNLNIDIKSFDAIKSAVLDNSVNMVIVGPEEPLVNGLGDFFKNDESLKKVVFVGPGSEGARLEGSKEFAKDFMFKYAIPTAGYKSFNRESIEEADRYIDSLKAPYVLKADGLAAGKGVLIIDDSLQAKRELREILSGRFGSAGDKVVIEEFLSGIELSVFVLTDGKNYLILPEAKDYKRACDGDKGLNTGGMGAVSPVPFADADFMSKVESRIIIPTIEGLQKESIDYKGFIFIGLMNCNGDPFVIEYNVRMGDPETEAVVPRIESDLLSHFIALGEGKLEREKIEISDRFAITLVMVSGGYPQNFEKGFEISGVSELTGEMLFHSGTSIKEGQLVTSGGRVIALTALADGIQSGRERLYSLAGKISYNGIFYRSDIGLDIL
ncbi:MAG: phosphoribosylamine--glycine ligase [Bacteroidales bacterium]|nr:phosphoribosylamine--glycine ligase [Bacteroidales bacterium]